MGRGWGATTRTRGRGTLGFAPLRALLATVAAGLDDGVTALAEPGSIIVQRGTIHSWRNPSPNETARIAFVLLDAKPVTVDGVPLEEIHPSLGRKP